MARFYTTLQIGPHTHETPEGYLVCEAVPIARTGEQTYSPQEVPIQPGPDGRCIVTRTPEEVFRPDTVASANIKSVCITHPEDDVNPKNWRELTVGIAVDPRRGEGVQSEQLLADLVIMDHDAIELVKKTLARDGNVELSCGYDCEYEDDGGGRGRQVNIVINHIAIVDRGRCGPVCSIRDHALPGKKPCGCSGGSQMAFKSKRFSQVRDAIMGLTKDCSDEDKRKAADVAGRALDEEKEEGEEEGEKKAKWTDDALDNRFDEISAAHATHDAKLKTHDSAIEALEKKTGESEEEKEAEKATEDALEEEAPEGTGDKARKAKDSAYLDESFQGTVSMAEIIAPGLHFPTYDRAAAPKKTYDAICGMRRKAISVAASTTDGAVLITQLRGGRVLTADAMTKMGCKDVRTLFLGLGAAKQRSNTVDSSTLLAMPGGHTGQGAKPITLAEINIRNRKHYGGDDSK